MTENLIKVKLLKEPNVIKETLSRIGIANRKDRILYPSCYLFQQGNDSYIAHFKELFPLLRQGGYSNISDTDYKRRNAIIFCLVNWGLIECDDDISDHDIFVFVLHYADKMDWEISHKFNRNLLNNIQEF